MDKVELTIQNGQTIYYPCVEEGITWETERKSYPGKLSFNVMADSTLNIEEGNLVLLKFGNANVFYGYIFTIQRSKENLLKITAYDQLRYLKNKHTMIYKNKTAAEVIKMIAEDFELTIGELEDTEYIFESRVEDNTTLFDIIETALAETTRQKNKIYVLYDKFGKLTLRNIESMVLPLLYDNDTIEDFDYTTSIDSETYNQIKLGYDNKDTGKRDIYMTRDIDNIAKWGVLQYYDKVNKPEDAKNKAAKLLEWYNRKSKSLSIKNALGDIRIRSGSSFFVKLDIAETQVQKLMIAEKVKHTFKNDEHLMDITLRGDIPIKYFTETNSTIVFDSE